MDIGLIEGNLQENQDKVKAISRNESKVIQQL